MRPNFYFLIFINLIFGISLYSQAPLNDDCDNPIDLGIAPVCAEDINLGTYFSNLNATPSDILPGDEEPAGCMGVGEPQTDVWFQFTAALDILSYTISVTGLDNPDTGEDAMVQPVVVLYRGDAFCFDAVEFQCSSAEPNSNVASMDINTELTPGLTYFLRVFDYGGSLGENSGSFQICIEETQDPVNLCDNVVVSSCEGEFYDCGGPNEDYPNNQNNTFTIMPEGGAACINLSLVYYHLGLFDSINIYDGPNTQSPIIDDINGIFQFSDSNGGVCKEIYATSGAMTIEFISDSSVSFEGFYATWNCSTEPCDNDIEDFVISEEPTEQDILNTINSPLSTVTITDINCSSDAYALFSNGDNTNLGLDKGLYLSSGSINEINNPGSFFANNNNDTPGDNDLTALSEETGGLPSADACVIEFDVFANTNEIKFEYVFGSEEYPEFVGSSFNDIFAFLISGPGIVGDPVIDNQFNMAILPDGTPIQINSVNNSQNYYYYRDNLEGPDLLYDGLTSDFQGVKKSLTALATVTPCNTYHLKMAIADRGDNSFDSGVFIGEIESGTPILEFAGQNGIDYLVENCLVAEDSIFLEIRNTALNNIEFDLTLSGSAELDVDYSLNIPETVIAEPGLNTYSYPISVINDNIVEGTENVIITLSTDYGCGVLNLGVLTIDLNDELIVEINSPDTIFTCNNQDCVDIEANGATSYFWSAPGANINPNTGPIIEGCFDGPQQVIVAGFLDVCFDSDTVYVIPINPEVSIQTNDETMICSGDSVTLNAINTSNGQYISWTPNDGSISDINNPIITVSPQASTTYTATIDIGNCIATDEIVINVTQLIEPSSIIPNTTICQGEEIVLGTGGNPNITDYEWLPNVNLQPNNFVVSATASPIESTTYTLTAASPNGFCSESYMTTVTVLPAEVTIENGNLELLCLGDQVDIVVNSSPGSELIWSPTEGLTPTTGNLVTAMPSETTTYTAIFENGLCSAEAQITIQVDSLPNDELLELVPDKEQYCEGEIVSLIFPTFNPNDYPNIQHLWTPNINLQSSNDAWNLVVLLEETITYTRTTTVGACESQQSVELEVIQTPDLTLIASPPNICEGDTVHFSLITNVDLDTVQWITDFGLNCDSCLDPFATPSETGTIQANAVVENALCPIMSNVLNIEVTPIPTISAIAEPEVICVEELSTLTASVNPDGTPIVWTDTDGNELSNELSFDVIPSSTTTYTVTTQAENACDDGQSQITVNVLDTAPTIELIASDNIICEGEEITLTVMTNSPIDDPEIIWEPNIGTGTSITFIPEGTNTYTATYIDGCDVNPSSSTTVQVNSSVTIDSIFIDPNTTHEGEPVTMTVFHTPATIDSPGYQWYYNDELLSTNGPTTTIQSPEVDFDGDTITTINIDVIVTDLDAECSAEDDAPLTILLSTFELPNIFSPNDDAYNNYLRPIIKGNTRISNFQVFNRWGQNVYDNDDNEIGWDGNYDGKPSPADVYAVFVTYINPLGEQIAIKQDVTLLR